MQFHAALGDAGSVFKGTMSSLIYSSETARSAGTFLLYCCGIGIAFCRRCGAVSSYSWIEAAEANNAHKGCPSTTASFASYVRAPCQGLCILPNPKGLMRAAHRRQ